jgi:dienelactone hydrolase
MSQTLRTAGAPAVVVLTGSTGGEDCAAAEGLAMSGYPALALAYFKEPGLPQCACAISLEYFARAVSWLRAQPAGRGRPVVLYGLSLGSEAVLLTASYLPHLADAVVASSPTVSVDASHSGTDRSGRSAANRWSPAQASRSPRSAFRFVAIVDAIAWTLLDRRDA